jgi:hypothetical protein
MAKATEIRPGSTGESAADRSRTAEETEQIRQALVARLEELQAEYDQALSEITELQRERFADSAGDDQADTGHQDVRAGTGDHAGQQPARTDHTGRTCHRSARGGQLRLV